jgi:hypothetical protein
MQKHLKIRIADLSFEDGILYARIYEGAEMELSDVKEIYDAGLQLSEGKPYCCLADVRGNPSSTPDSRAFGAAEGYSEFRLADAILANSTMMKLVVNVYINFNKPRVPTKMFDSEEKAVEWLKSFLK